MRRVFLSLLFLLLSSPLFAFCFDEAGRIYGIDPDLLRAIAVVESGMRQDVVSGTGDVGVMQINAGVWKGVLRDRWRFVVEDPCYNVMVGAWILAGCIRRHGYTWRAVGCYHSGRPGRQERYAEMVYRAYRRIRRK